MVSSFCSEVLDECDTEVSVGDELEECTVEVAVVTDEVLEESVSVDETSTLFGCKLVTDSETLLMHAVSFEQVQAIQGHTRQRYSNLS